MASSSSDDQSDGGARLWPHTPPGQTPTQTPAPKNDVNAESAESCSPASPPESQSQSGSQQHGFRAPDRFSVGNPPGNNIPGANIPSYTRDAAPAAGAYRSAAYGSVPSGSHVAPRLTYTGPTQQFYTVGHTVHPAEEPAIFNGGGNDGLPGQPEKQVGCTTHTSNLESYKLKQVVSRLHTSISRLPINASTAFSTLPVFRMACPPNMRSSSIMT